MISIILTVFNKGELVTNFFSRNVHQMAPHEYILVDNGSRRRTAAKLDFLAARENIQVIHNNDNLGFGVANNIGAEAAHGDILVFTQPDVHLLGDITLPLATHVEDGALYGHVLFDYDTGWNVFQNGEGRVVVPYLAGYFLACTPTTWSQIGGFDPIYWPADFEDVDLSLTATKKGIPLRTLPFQIEHPHFGSTWAQFDDRKSYTIKNQQRFMDKWGLTL